jgi:hypothetical protein
MHTMILIKLEPIYILTHEMLTAIQLFKANY